MGFIIIGYYLLSPLLKYVPYFTCERMILCSFVHEKNGALRHAAVFGSARQSDKINMTF